MIRNPQVAQNGHLAASVIDVPSDPLLDRQDANAGPAVPVRPARRDTEAVPLGKPDQRAARS